MKPLKNSPRSKSEGTESIKKKAFKRAQLRVMEMKGFGQKSMPKRAIPSIELFQKEECPFSQAVRQKISDLGLDIVSHSVPDGLALKHEMLVQAGGKDQLPFMVDHKTGIKLYESDAILAYLGKEYSTPETLMREEMEKLENPSLTDRILNMASRPVRKKIRFYEKRISDMVDTLSGTYRMVSQMLPRRLRARS